MRHNMVTKTLPSSYHIDAPGTQLQTNQVTPLVEILIEEVLFSTNFIVRDTRGVDVMLEMNWLTNYNALIDCASRIISLKNTNGVQIPLHLGEGDLRLYTLNIVIAKDLLDILVVCEFSGVFPEELTGMPPDRTVKFSIDLLSDTALISKKSYKMPPNELAELKKQLKKLLTLGMLGTLCEEEGWHSEDVY